MSIEQDLRGMIKRVTREFTSEKRKTAREARLSTQARTKLSSYRYRETFVKAAAFTVMRQAYLKASANNTLPAKARQIMYAARPLVQELTTRRFKNDYLQSLIDEYIEKYPNTTADWNVAYDARGSLTEPHTKKHVPLGTLEVRSYRNQWIPEISAADHSRIAMPHGAKTVGPINRYKYALFVEKEGFNELWQSVDLANRYDIAIMSTKGMSTRAARELIEELSSQGVTIFVMHDFDKSGFSILHTLRSDTRKWQYSITPNVIDLGLRLGDITGLQREDVYYNSKVNPACNLRQSGATDAEINILVNQGSWRGWQGERVELNAMDSGELVNWVESKLKQHGIEKLIPSEEDLEQQYRNAHRIALLETVTRKAAKDYRNEKIEIPSNLSDLVQEQLKRDKGISWDEAVWRILHND